MHDPVINRCVERLCEQGCQSVRHAIRRLSDDQLPAGAGPLTATQRREVLRELRAIMAVYDRRDSACE